MTCVCQSPFEQINSSNPNCYYYNYNQLTYMQATNACLAMGGELLTFDTATEYAQVQGGP
jgi:hypothetical protein